MFFIANDILNYKIIITPNLGKTKLIKKKQKKIFFEFFI